MAYYVQLDADYWDHPKTLKLIELLGARGEIIPVKMWTWAARFKKTGVFDSPSQLATACRFRGKPQALQDALKKAGFLEPDGLTIHDWWERTGAGIAMYEKERERKRLVAERRREESRGSSALPSALRSGNVAGGSSKEVAPLTGPDLTVPDLNDLNSPPPPHVGGPLDHLLRLARSQKIAGQEGTIRRFVEAWAARVGAAECEKMLMASAGHTVMDIQDRYFQRNGNGTKTMAQVLDDWVKQGKENPDGSHS